VLEHTLEIFVELDKYIVAVSMRSNQCEISFINTQGIKEVL